MDNLFQSISKKVEDYGDEAISFLQQLVRTPSESCEESEASRLVADMMQELGFAVKVDSLNDVMATLKGTGGGRDLLLNGHLDHVPAGNMPNPYSGNVIDGSIFGVDGDVVYGRGASDMKGAIAAMVMAGGIIQDLDIRLTGDFKVVAVTQEEVGGQGTLSTVQEDRFLGDIVVVGEATDMNIALGHRGGAGMTVIVRGRSCHASAPDRGTNALYKAMDLISRVRSDLIPQLPIHPIFGATTLTVTRIGVKPNANNVVPEECEFYIDCRNTPNYPADELKSALEEIISSARMEDPELEALVMPRNLVRGMRGFTGFYTDPEANQVVREARETVAMALGREPKLTVWRFATDGRFYSWLGIPVIGFGPGEERFAHTHQDHVKVADYLNTVRAYACLACRICGVE